jgi:DNA polymerase III delta prime subunit
MTTRLATATDAVRPALKGRLMMSGPPGSGKTRSALIVATTLLDDEPVNPDGSRRILVVDTEKESALTYADDFTFRHLRWAAPFSPVELAENIRAAGADYDVIVVDSLTHFWRMDGGTLDIANGQFSGWKEARPAQTDLVEAILETDAHVILCVRSKMAHEQVNEGGRWVVKKLGVQAIQDDDLEYEMNVSVALDMGHTISVSKSRTVALPVGRDFKPNHAADMAAIYRDWLRAGEAPAPSDTVKALVDRMNALEPEAFRKATKAAFVAQLGRPDHLRETQVDDAETFVDDAETEMAAAAGHKDETDTDGTDTPEDVETPPADDETPVAKARRAVGAKKQTAAEAEARLADAQAAS